MPYVVLFCTSLILQTEQFSPHIIFLIMPIVSNHLVFFRPSASSTPIRRPREDNNFLKCLFLLLYPRNKRCFQCLQPISNDSTRHEFRSNQERQAGSGSRQRIQHQGPVLQSYILLVIVSFADEQRVTCVLFS